VSANRVPPLISASIFFSFFLCYLSESNNRQEQERQIEEDLQNFQTALKESKVTLMPQLSTTFSALAKVSYIISNFI